MVYRVLSIVTKILFSLMSLAFVVCLVWTLATAAVQEGFETASSAVEQMVSDAMDAMQVEWGVDLSGVLGAGSGAGSSASGASGSGSGVGATDAGRSGSGASGGGFDLVGSLTGLVSGLGLGGSADLTAADFANPAYGQAYLTWKSAIDDPVARIFDGTGITSVLLEGVAGGSSSAGDALAKLDETALTLVGSNAASYASTAASNAVPANLPEGVRALMWEANSAAQGFAASVQSVVTAVRGVKAGNAAAWADLASAANALVEEVRTLETCMAQAELQLMG